MKPPFYSYFWNNYKYLVLFLIGTNLAAFMLTHVKFVDLLSFRLWFYSSMFVLSVVIIGGAISYNKTYPKK